MVKMTKIPPLDDESVDAVSVTYRDLVLPSLRKARDAARAEVAEWQRRQAEKGPGK